MVTLMPSRSQCSIACITASDFDAPTVPAKTVIEPGNKARVASLRTGQGQSMHT
jgi:hypothetical protein